ncbi:MAG: PP2C family protein-serine/threonine phosphatase [Candidatus Hydrogenedentota bacterium]
MILSTMEALVRREKWKKLAGPPEPITDENRDAYDRARAREFRQQIGVIVNITIMAIIIHTTGAWLFPRIADPVPLVLVLLALVGESFLWLASRRIVSLPLIQALSICAFLIPLALMIKAAALDISYYLVVIFVMGFLLPWNGREALIVSLAPVVFFFFNHGVQRELLGTADESFVFFISTLIVVRLQLKQERDRRVAFRLETEAEEARKSLIESLRLAAKLHGEIISRDMDLENLSVRVLYESMQELGGDYVKIAPIDGRRTSMLVADVTGHGAPAALMVNRINTKVESIMTSRLGPARAAAELNAFATKAFEGTAMLMSALWTEYDAAARKIRWSNYGHPPPVFLERRTRTVRLLSSNSYVMGIDIPQLAPESAIDVSAGDLILFYTDGLIEWNSETGPFDLWSLVGHLEGLFTKTTDTLTADRLINAMSQLVRSKRIGEAKDDLLVIVWEVR